MWIVDKVILTAAITLAIIYVFVVFFGDIFTWQYWDAVEVTNTSKSEVVRNLGLLGAAIIGLIFGIWRAYTAHRQANIALRQTDVTERGLFNERFTAAIEHLGSHKLPIRLGGIHALWNLSKDAPEKNIETFLNIFCAYVRNPPYPAPIENKENEAIDIKEIILPDVQEILNIICVKRNMDQINVPSNYNLIFNGAFMPQGNFIVAHMPSADLRNTNLQNSNFTFANLFEADLSEANLKEADFNGADLFRAIIQDVDMTNARYLNANLSEAILTKSDLSGANMSKAYFLNADISETIMTKTDFTDANMSNANLYRAKLHGANMYQANLSGANLREASFQNANMFKANLTSTSLIKSDLSGANLKFTNLSGANMQDVLLSGNKLALNHRVAMARFDIDITDIELSQNQLDQAVAEYDNPPYNLPEGLVWRGSPPTDGIDE